MTADNPLKNAIKMEMDSIKFYQECSAKAGNPLASKMFLSITKDEDRHLKVLEEYMKTNQFNFKNDSERSIIEKSRNIFNDVPEDVLKTIESTSDDSEDLELAVKMEDEGRAMYLKMAEEARDDKEAEFFKFMASEEDEHFRVFQSTADFLRNPGEWYASQDGWMLDGGAVGGT